jgi:DNA-binding NarL/FixJ family response regulator
MDILRLAIVDGHSGVREALAQRLQRIPGIRVVGAVGDVHDALRVLQEQAPDAVIYDPRTVAGEAHEALTALASGGRAVIVLTASLLYDEAEALRRAGAADLLLKGASVATLLAAIKAAISASGRGC